MIKTRQDTVPPCHHTLADAGDGQALRLAGSAQSDGAAPGSSSGVCAFARREADAVVLGRDPSGLCDLYWHRDKDGQISYAHSLDALLSDPGVPQRLSRRSLHEFLRFGDLAAPNTLFEDIHAVEPGQRLRVSAAGVDMLSWPQPAGPIETPAAFDDAINGLDGLLQRSVSAPLEGAARPAAFLSGGVDSSLICAIAARARPDMTAITVGFDGAAHDESALAQRVAAHLGLQHRVLRFSHDELVAAFERLVRHMDQPTADPATPATVLAFDHVREHHDVVLDGTGADEAVGALPPRHVRVAVQYASLLPPALRRSLLRPMRAVAPLARYAPIIDFEHPADTMIRWRGFTRSEIEALCGEPVSFEHTRFYQTFDRFARGAHFERYSALVDAMPCERLTQATLASPAPVRYPFCDLEVDRYIRRLPTDWRHTPTSPKRILRELLARYVPRDLWAAPKHGFDFPLQQFLQARDFALVRSYLDPDRWRAGSVLPADGVWRYAMKFMAGDMSQTFRVWQLVVLGAWLHKHKDLH